MNIFFEPADYAFESFPTKGRILEKNSRRCNKAWRYNIFIDWRSQSLGCLSSSELLNVKRKGTPSFSREY
jgi:hypothetical protein